MPGGCQFLLELAFFGLTAEYKIYLHREIFNLAYYSEGAFNQQIAYNLPVYLRRFYTKELQDAKKKEADHMKSGESNTQVTKGMVGPGGNLLGNAGGGVGKR